MKKGWEPQLDVLFHKYITYGCALEYSVNKHYADGFATPHLARIGMEGSKDALRRSEG